MKITVDKKLFSLKDVLEDIYCGEKRVATVCSNYDTSIILKEDSSFNKPNWVVLNQKANSVIILKSIKEVLDFFDSVSIEKMYISPLGKMEIIN